MIISQFDIFCELLTNALRFSKTFIKLCDQPLNSSSTKTSMKLSQCPNFEQCAFQRSNLSEWVLKHGYFDKTEFL